MKPGTKKLFLSLFAFLCFYYSQSQQATRENTFSIKLNVPVILDEELKTEYVPERMQDKFQEFRDKKTSVTVGANNCMLNYSGQRFWGTWKNTYFPHDQFSIRGTISADGLMLETMYFDYLKNTNDKYRKESEVLSLRFENVPMYNGNCFFDKSSSKIYLLNYKYSTVEINPDYYTRTHEKTGKAIDFDEIPREPKLATWKFRIQLNMHGPPSFKIDVKNIHDPDSLWVAPLFVNSEKLVPVEPRSIGIYEKPPPWIFPGSVNTVLHFFLEIPGIKVLERSEIEKIIQEQKLANSGLVAKNGLKKNHLFSEEIAIVTKYQADHKIFECTVSSKTGKIRVEAFPVSEENYDHVITPFCVEIEKAVTELLNTPVK